MWKTSLRACACSPSRRKRRTARSPPRRARPRSPTSATATATSTSSTCSTRSAASCATAARRCRCARRSTRAPSRWSGRWAAAGTATEKETNVNAINFLKGVVPMARSKAKPELHWISGSPYAWRVMLALEVKQVPYVSRLLDSSKGDTKTPEFLRLNPRGHVPVLTHGDYVLTESLAILAYLDREFPTPPIFGEYAYETAQVWRVISEFLSYLQAPLNRVVLPIYGDKVAEKAEDIRAAMPAVRS